jgi:hypothetical protein
MYAQKIPIHLEDKKRGKKKSVRLGRCTHKKAPGPSTHQQQLRDRALIQHNTHKTQSKPSNWRQQTRCNKNNESLIELQEQLATLAANLPHMDRSVGLKVSFKMSNMDEVP